MKLVDRIVEFFVTHKAVLAFKRWAKTHKPVFKKLMPKNFLRILLIILLIFTAFFSFNHLKKVIGNNPLYYYGLPDREGFYLIKISANPGLKVSTLTFPGINIYPESFHAFTGKCFPSQEEMSSWKWEELREGWVNLTGDVVLRLSISSGPLIPGEYPNILFLGDKARLFTVGLGETTLLEPDDIPERERMFIHGSNLVSFNSLNQHRPANNFIQEYALHFMKGETPEFIARGIMTALWFAQTPYNPSEPKTYLDTELAERMVKEDEIVSSCEHHAQLFISTLRALGIPARNVEIFMVRNNTVYSKLSHSLVEFWTPEKGWVVADSMGIYGFHELEEYTHLYGDTMLFMTYEGCTFYNKGKLERCPEKVTYIDDYSKQRYETLTCFN